MAGIIGGLLFSNNYYFSILCQIMCYFIAALGMNFITGMIGQPNLGAAGVFALGAYTSALLAVKAGISPWLGIFAAMGMGWIVGKTLGYPSLRVEGVYLSLTTIVFSEIIRIVLNNATDFCGGASGLKQIPAYDIGGFPLDKPNHMFVFLVIVSLLLSYIAYRITRSRWGRAFIAVRDNMDAVESCGINVSRMKVSAYTFCCVFIAIAGALYAHFVRYLNPSTFVQTFSNTFVVMLIVGGLGLVSGAFIGTILVTILPELLRFTGSYYQFAYALIVLLCILLLPGGIIPSLSKKQGSTRAMDIIRIFIGKRKGDKHERHHS